MINVITDIDGVVLNWDKGFQNWLCEIKDIHAQHDGVNTDYNMKDKYHLTDEEIYDLIDEFNASHHFESLEFINGVEEYMKPMLEDPSMCWTWVSSALPERDFHETVEIINRRKRNLSSLAPNMFGVSLRLRSSKYDTLKSLYDSYSDVNILIEDSLSHALDGIKLNYKSILLDYGHNQHHDLEDLIRVKNWKDISNFLQTLSTNDCIQS